MNPGHINGGPIGNHGPIIGISAGGRRLVNERVTTIAAGKGVRCGVISKVDAKLKQHFDGQQAGMTSLGAMLAVGNRTVFTHLKT